VPGFTLVELLIIVTIVAVLAAILCAIYVGASRPRQSKAKGTVSAQNLWQLYLAHALYSEDHQGLLCPYPTSVQNPTAYWAALAGWKFVDELPSMNKQALTPYIRDANTWYCSADPNAKKVSWPPMPDYNVDHRVTSYVYEPMLGPAAFNAWRDSTPRPLFFGVTMDADPDAARVDLVWEPATETATPSETSTYWGDLTRNVVNRFGALRVERVEIPVP
jgi:Tfp pilus assembly protein PilE